MFCELLVGIMIKIMLLFILSSKISLLSENFNRSFQCFCIFFFFYNDTTIQCLTLKEREERKREFTFIIRNTGLRNNNYISIFRYQMLESQ